MWQKVKQELAGFKKVFQPDSGEVRDMARLQSEFGDLLFSLVDYARFIHIDPEEALERTNKKFIKLFQFLKGNQPRMENNWAR